MRPSHIPNLKLAGLSLTAGSAGAKDEDKLFTRLLKEEEELISHKIVSLRKDV